MAQHDFVPAWLNFSTPRPVKSPAVSLEKHGEHVSRGDGRQAVNRRRHNSSDGFFNNGPLRAPGVDVWQQPSLLRHDSVDSGVSKGPHVGLVSSQGWKENNSSWHSTAREPMNQHHRSGGERLASHRQWNGNVHPRKSAVFQEKPPPEAREEKRDIKEDKLKFMEEDFPSLNPEAGNQISHNKPMGTPAGVWENPPSAKQTVSKMLVIKKVSKEDPSAAFSAGFAVTQPILANGNKIPIAGPSVYKNLVPKVTAPSAKQTPPGNSSTTPPVDINPPRLVKLMRRSDKKSEFLKTLKDDQNGDASACHSPTAQEEGESSTPEPKDYGEGICYQNGLSLSAIDSDSEHLSSSLEAEHRLLKAMGWQEHPENDENYLPLTEDELKEFQAKTEQLKKNSSGQSSSLLKPRSLHLGPWRSTLKTEMDEGSESETSSSETSDDDT
ncbi:vasculin-like protein 1 isoform X3 [Erpetoichthys calabaricus]|uniref:GC-rich promoter binding protein 1 like 1 n=1 Tax=Erpetoichthys calabaricus TaxID=27687 RepID=A0A8C4TKW5_ERPCA|nr:vasculin-like protein 1 isoform X3 [Erpetoichthys calabaricus]